MSLLRLLQLHMRLLLLRRWRLSLHLTLTHSVRLKCGLLLLLRSQLLLVLYLLWLLLHLLLLLLNLLCVLLLLEQGMVHDDAVQFCESGLRVLDPVPRHRQLLLGGVRRSLMRLAGGNLCQVLNLATEISFDLG